MANLMAAHHEHEAVQRIEVLGEGVNLAFPVHGLHVVGCFALVDGLAKAGRSIGHVVQQDNFRGAGHLRADDVNAGLGVAHGDASATASAAEHGHVARLVLAGFNGAEELVKRRPDRL